MLPLATVQIEIISNCFKLVLVSKELAIVGVFLAPFLFSFKITCREKVLWKEKVTYRLLEIIEVGISNIN